MRYIDSTLAAYVGETVLLRYDPRDIAEVRLFHQDKFLCRAICPELAGQTVPLRDIQQARDQQRRRLRETLRDRRKDGRIIARPAPGTFSRYRGTAAGCTTERRTVSCSALKRYRNE